LAFAGCFGATRKHSHNKRLTAGTALRWPLAWVTGRHDAGL